jgi:CRISPR-associated endonuclease Cas3-HD
MTEYFAHSPKEGYPAQTYAQHVNGVLNRVRCFASETAQYSVLDGKMLLRVSEIAAIYHDLGKLDQENQPVLSGHKAARSLPINHADAGAAFLLDDTHISILAAIAIASHHMGLPDFVSESNRGESMFRDDRVKEAVDAALSKYSRIHDSIIDTKPLADTSMPSGDLPVFLRLLLSCLVDADHTDTAIHYRKYPDEVNTIPLRPAERLVKLDQYVEELKQNGVNDERNTLRNEMYFTCRDTIIDSAISSCDSPVGSGKTTAVMAHLLAQAERRGLRRIFVVLPFTNIIRQSVKTYREGLVLPGEKADDVVAELHHRADFESEDARHLTALWRAPIIVTTAVAFFETLASNSTATLRRLHELPGSAVFVDESHAALPSKLLPLAWKWINIYASEWNCYWVLASGSLNRFWTIPEIAGVYNTNCIPEIIDDRLHNQLSVYENNRITYKCDLWPKGTAELVDWISGYPGPRLVILNTIQSAAIIADYFSEYYGRNCVEHLSTALTSNDRDSVLERVIKRLNNKEDADWTLVATSCVEAGVNLSFKNGFRELGSLVSLLQASGRVNREGILDNSEMWTFCILEDGMLKLNPGMKESASVLKEYLERQITVSPELSTQSISNEIALYGLSGKYKNLIISEELRKFPEVDRDFKVIDTETRLVVTDSNIADNIKRGNINWKELQKVSVQIPKYKLDELGTPKVLDNIYFWNIDYNDFLGYMAGIIPLIKFDGFI